MSNHFYDGKSTGIKIKEAFNIPVSTIIGIRHQMKLPREYNTKRSRKTKSSRKM